jgi:3-keto-L-gulonate-6-phosphate decarboxylase
VSAPAAGAPAARRLLDGGPKVQISLDLTNLKDALATAEVAVRAGVDWIEAGTPLLLAEGLHAVRALHERYPRHPVVADLKTMDAGYLEAEMVFKAGASFVVVMGQAHGHTIREAVRAARDKGALTMGDVMLCPDKVEMARQMERWGVDVVIVHTGLAASRRSTTSARSAPRSRCRSRRWAGSRSTRRRSARALGPRSW